VMDIIPSMDTNSIRKVAGMAIALLDWRHFVNRHLFRLAINFFVSSVTHLLRKSLNE
jgi:hypothetical protein